MDFLYGIQGLLKIVLRQPKLLFGNPSVVEDLSYFVTRNSIASTISSFDAFPLPVSAFLHDVGATSTKLSNELSSAAIRKQPISSRCFSAD